MPDILIVDDDKQVVSVLTDILQHTSREYRVSTAPDASRALDSVKRQRPDVVLLDVEMPGMDGVDALQHIKTVDGSIPVIMHRKPLLAGGGGAAARRPRLHPEAVRLQVYPASGRGCGLALAPALGLVSPRGAAGRR